MKRSILCILVCVCIMLAVLLCACTATKKSATANYWQETIPEQVPQQTVPQADMPREELDLALTNIDMSLLCAGLDTTCRVERANGNYTYIDMTYCGDYDNDGDPEVLVDGADFIFDLSEGRAAMFCMQDSPPMYYTDHDGNIYRMAQIADADILAGDGTPMYESYVYTDYSLRKGDYWDTAFRYNAKVVGDGSTDVTMQGLSDPSKFHSYEVEAELNGKAVTMKELADHCEEIGLQQICSQPGDFTTNRYDSQYRDSLVSAMEDYFTREGFSWDMIHSDLDDDGVAETVFALYDLDDLWRGHIDNSYNEMRKDGEHWFENLFLKDYSYTGLVLVDTRQEQVIVDAYCTVKSVNIHGQLRLEKGFFYWDNTRVYLSGGFTDLDASQVPEALAMYLEDYGYSNCILRKADVSDHDGAEYVCICQKNGEWYLLVMVLDKGEPRMLYGRDMADKAFYITKIDGKECLMIYTQDAFHLSNGVHRTEYSYEIFRFDRAGQWTSLESENVGYNDNNQDATEVSRFFDKLNGYMVNIIVLRDPYALTGKQWMGQAETDYGTVPTEQEESEDATIGFVQIQDPSSWLNLREGPGTEYARVLMDPFDPDSFVRQAQGSPVTVLETIQTGDPENPVWLKIRITYANREIIGYSSKRFIRLAEE